MDFPIGVDLGDNPTWTGIHTWTASLKMPNGTAAAPALTWNTNYGLSYDPANFLQASSTALVASIAGQGDFAMARSSTGSSNFYCTSNANSANNTVWGFGSGANTNLGQYNIRRSHGGYAAPTFPVQNDFIGDIRWSISNIANTANSIALRGVVIDTTPGSAAAQGRLICLLSPAGSATLTETFRFDSATGFSMFGTNQVVDANRLFHTRSYLTGSLPTAIDGAIAEVSDATLTSITGHGTMPIGGGSNHVLVYADNVGWKII